MDCILVKLVNTNITLFTLSNISTKFTFCYYHFFLLNQGNEGINRSTLRAANNSYIWLPLAIITLL